MDQASQNRTTERQWQMYATHRARIERLILPSTPGQSLCVLGAGNCNDLDLSHLAKLYGRIHLVDLDADAVQAAIRRQKAPPESFVVHAPFDLTGAGDLLPSWKAQRPDAKAITHATSLVRSKPLAPWAPCDVVLSPCVLTQTITPFRDATRELSPPADAAARALRAALIDRHVRLIAASTAAGARAVLVIDLVSSEKVPDLARVPEDEVAPAMSRLIAAGKTFRGVDSASLTAAARRAGLVAQTPPEPWLWHLGLRKSFLVYALSLLPRPPLAERPRSFIT